MFRYSPALILAFTLCAAEKKPVTLDAVGGASHGDGGASIVWAPDGKRFAYAEKGSLIVYDVPSKSSRQLLDFRKLQDTAVKPAASTASDWENRRIDEEHFQWSASGEQLLIAEEGAETTRYEKIFVAPPLQYDFARLENRIAELSDAAEAGDEDAIYEIFSRMNIGFRPTNWKPKEKAAKSSQ